MKRLLNFLRDRWGGGIRPSVKIDHDSEIERWDGEGAGRATFIIFEGFGWTASLNIGRTPGRKNSGA